MFFTSWKSSSGSMAAQLLLLLLVYCTLDVSAAVDGDGITLETQLYITAGLLGGLTLLLCGSVVYLMLTVSSIQSDLTRLATKQGLEASSQPSQQEQPPMQEGDNKSPEILDQTTVQQPSQQLLQNSASAARVIAPPQTTQQLQRQLSFQDSVQPGSKQPASMQPASARSQDPYAGRAPGPSALRLTPHQPPPATTQQQRSAPPGYQQPSSPKPQPYGQYAPYRQDRESYYHRPSSRPPPRVYSQDRY